MGIAKTIDTMLVEGTFHRVVLFAAQPGDIIRAAGELLQLARSVSAEIRVILMTQGNPRPWLQRVISDGPRYQSIRKCQQHDAVQALMTLGVARNAIHFLDYATGELSNGLLTYRANLIEAVVTELTKFRPTLVVTPSRCDLNADNNATGILTSLALARLSHLAAVHLSYIVNGPAPAIPLANRVLLQSDRERVALKARALQAVRMQHQGRDKDQNAGPTQPEIFIESEADAQIGTLFCAMQNACSTHIALKPKRGAEQRLWVYPTVSRTYPACITLAATGVLQLGSRQSDSIQVEKDTTGVSLDIGSYVDPLWIKLDLANGTENLDLTGWHRVQPLLRTANRRLACVIPCYNVADSVIPLLEQAGKYVDCIVAVDDGSTDDTLARLESAAQDMPFLQVLSYSQNRGKGHALVAGMRHALATADCGILVTMNADAQHNPADIPALVEAQRTSNSVMTVAVCKYHAAMPFRVRLRNFLVSALTRIKYRRLPSDIGSGFRAITRDFTLEILEQIVPSRYTTEIEILTLCLRRHQVASAYLDSQDGNARRYPCRSNPPGSKLRMLASFARCCMTRSQHSIKTL